MIEAIAIIVTVSHIITCETTFEPFYPWENEFPNPTTTIAPVWTPSTLPSGPTLITTSVKPTSSPIVSTTGVPTVTSIYFPGYIWNGQGGWTPSNSADCNSLRGVARFVCQFLPRFFFNLQADAMNG